MCPHCIPDHSGRQPVVHLPYLISVRVKDLRVRTEGELETSSADHRFHVEW